MKKFYDWTNGWIPIVWGILWTEIITIGSVAGLIAVTKWLLKLLGGVVNDG